MGTVTDLESGPKTEDPDKESIEGMAGEDGEEEHLEEIVTGTHGQLGWTVGGRKPDGSKVSIGSAGRDVDGQFKKGDVVQILVTGRVDEVTFRDKHDSQGVAIECTRMHSIKPLSVRVYDDEEGAEGEE